jgi:hypothetical protein
MDAKAQKKKDREKRVKRQLFLQRDAKQKEDKKKREWEERMELETNPNNIKQKPFRHADQAAAANKTPEDINAEKAKNAEIRAKLEHNLAVLQALEQEWKREQFHKGNVNAALEADGAVDLKSKMDMMNEKFLKTVQDMKDSGQIAPTGEVQLGGEVQTEEKDNPGICEQAESKLADLFCKHEEIMKGPVKGKKKD